MLGWSRSSRSERRHACKATTLTSPCIFFHRCIWITTFYMTHLSRRVWQQAVNTFVSRRTQKKLCSRLEEETPLAVNGWASGIRLHVNGSTPVRGRAI